MRLHTAGEGDDGSHLDSVHECCSTLPALHHHHRLSLFSCCCCRRADKVSQCPYHIAHTIKQSSPTLALVVRKQGQACCMLRDFPSQFTHQVPLQCLAHDELHLAGSSLIRVAPQATQVGGLVAGGQCRDVFWDHHHKLQQLGNPVGVRGICQQNWV